MKKILYIISCILKLIHYRCYYPSIFYSLTNPLDALEQAEFDKVKLRHDTLRKYIVNVNKTRGWVYELAKLQIMMAQMRRRLWWSPALMEKAAGRWAKHLYTLL